MPICVITWRGFIGRRVVFRGATKRWRGRLSYLFIFIMSGKLGKGGIQNTRRIWQNLCQRSFSHSLKRKNIVNSL